MCGEKVWAEDVETHQGSECLCRIKPCPLGCNATGITFKNEGDHLVNECSNRIVECRCGKSMIFNELSDHVIADCPKKLNLCPQGCGEQIPRDELAYHMKKLCPNQDSWGRQVINCPARCGKRMMRKEFLEHISYHCGYRLAECPLHCGNYLKFDKVNAPPLPTYLSPFHMPIF